MKLLLITALALGTSIPTRAGEYQAGYSTSRVCTRMEYREEYVPGTEDNPGYVRSWQETVEFPCDRTVSYTHLTLPTNREV